MKRPAAFRYRGLVSPYGKADLTKRFSAAGIDGLLVTSLLIMYRQLDSVLFVAVAAFYLLFRDALFVPGQSVGKFLMGLLVVSLETGKPCTRGGCVRRNAFLLLPLVNLVVIAVEAVLIVRDPQGQRYGDRLAQTQVVEGLGARDLVKLFQQALLEAPAPHRRERPVEVDP